MTVSTTAWLNLMRTFGACFHMEHCLVDGVQPLSRPIADFENIQLCCNDVLQLLRSISSRPAPRFSGDRSFTTDCHEMLRKISGNVLRVLRKSSMRCYVLCLDPYGMSRPEKAHTASKRAEQSRRRTESGASQQLEVPPHQQRYFERSRPLPGDMNSVFATPRARIDLYDFVTAYFQSDEFRSQLDPGKQFVLSGGLRMCGPTSDPHANYTQVAPFAVTCDGCSTLYELAHHQVSEGDLDVWRFVLSYDGNAVVESGDGDVLLAGLVLMRTIFADDAERTVYFRTRRKVGELAHPPAMLEAHARRHETYLRVLRETNGDKRAAHLASDGASTPQPRTKGKTVWGPCWVDMHMLWASMIKDAHQLMEDVGIEIPCPVEQWVVLMCMASDSHDYFDRKRIVKGAGARPVLLAYLEHIHAIGPVVRMSFHEDSKHGHYSYMIDTEALLRWALYAYYEAAATRNRRDSAVNARLSDDAYHRKIMAKAEDFAKKCPGTQSALVGASQLAWVLHYYNTGPRVTHHIIDGREKHPQTGESLFGFVSGGFAQSVTQDPVRVCGC